jgi:hypothetical protein
MVVRGARRNAAPSTVQHKLRRMEGFIEAGRLGRTNGDFKGRLLDSVEGQTLNLNLTLNLNPIQRTPD